MKMNTRRMGMVGEMLLSALVSTLAGAALISVVVLPVRAQTLSAYHPLSDVDGEHGLLHVKGELTDSPCRLTMDSMDQTIDLGTLASADLAYPGARSAPVRFILRLQDCLVASGHIRDTRSGGTVFGVNHPVVSVSFTAPADFSDPSLMRLHGVQGIALRMTDVHNHDVRLGSRGVPHLLTPGDNQLGWTVVAERTPEALVPGPFRATADFRLSYD